LKIGVFTPLLSNYSLRDVLVHLKTHNIDTVELALGITLKDPSLLKPGARPFADFPDGHSEGYDDTF
jgi:hypothetical protein